MNKKPVEVNVTELEDILDRYLDSGDRVNYALKIVGHPGVGKSAIVRQAAERKTVSSSTRDWRSRRTSTWAVTRCPTPPKGG